MFKGFVWNAKMSIGNPLVIYSFILVFQRQKVCES